jgi:hypothetical protein
MPEYAPTYVGHCWLCEKAWQISCVLHGRWGAGNCPLDGIGPKKKWHKRHNEKKVGQKLAEWDKVEMASKPSPEVCVPWVENVLRRPELNHDVFGEFFEDVKNLAPSVRPGYARLCKHVRFREYVHLCWTAHLVADYACLYWHTATGQQEKYRFMNKDDQTTMGGFVKDVGSPILNRWCPMREELQAVVLG